MVTYSILDLAPIGEGRSTHESLTECARVAQAAEASGYQRYWLAEHHGMKAVGSSATSVLLSYVGSKTESIRIGSGGVMLPNHSPLVIAEQFGTLAELYPNRVEVGLGRAPGTDMRTAQALRRNVNESVDSYPQDIQALQDYFDNGHNGIQATPGHQTHLPIWMLGSSLYSAQLAAELGLPFAFASHFAPDYLIQAITIYRRLFKPSQQLEKPYVMVGIMASVAETDEQANYLMTSSQQQFLNLRRGVSAPFPKPTDNMEGWWSPSEKHMVEHTLQYSVSGSKETVRFKLERFLEATKADEIIASFPIYDTNARLDAIRGFGEAIRT
ncbi:MsnO8 family LLM class oxidoreductase [Marinomonas mediterranea]|uniref:LLM class flavin-dependent oxidoreductase n=1 Tax=Marinomonas mediterranea TaxID=119864 RepID=UPI00234A3071|nr:LLM class flavin-dependent oxidoreductase [Marinomonas mediterranea]WCN14083.1 MsnO8 family LLM class oxidoreductase [Marinomonas mediterranea]